MLPLNSPTWGSRIGIDSITGKTTDAVVEVGHHAAIDEAAETLAAEAKEKQKRAATKKALRRF